MDGRCSAVSKYYQTFTGQDPQEAGPEQFLLFFYETWKAADKRAYRIEQKVATFVGLHVIKLALTPPEGFFSNLIFPSKTEQHHQVMKLTFESVQWLAAQRLVGSLYAPEMTLQERTSHHAPVHSKPVDKSSVQSSPNSLISTPANSYNFPANETKELPHTLYIDVKPPNFEVPGVHTLSKEMKDQATSALIKFMTSGIAYADTTAELACINPELCHCYHSLRAHQVSDDPPNQDCSKPVSLFP